MINLRLFLFNYPTPLFKVQDILRAVRLSFRLILIKITEEKDFSVSVLTAWFPGKTTDETALFRYHRGLEQGGVITEKEWETIDPGKKKAVQSQK